MKRLRSRSGRRKGIRSRRRIKRSKRSRNSRSNKSSSRRLSKIGMKRSRRRMSVSDEGEVESSGVAGVALEEVR